MVVLKQVSLEEVTKFVFPLSSNVFFASNWWQNIFFASSSSSPSSLSSLSTDQRQFWGQEMIVHILEWLYTQRVALAEPEMWLKATAFHRESPRPYHVQAEP